MSKPVSAVAVAEPMKPGEAAAFHLRVLGKPFGSWHKPKAFNEAQLKFGVGIPFNVGSNEAKRRRHAVRGTQCGCGRMQKNCGLHCPYRIGRSSFASYQPEQK